MCVCVGGGVELLPALSVIRADLSKAVLTGDVRNEDL